MKWQQDEFIVTDNREDLDIEMIHDFLCKASYWAKHIPRATVEKSVNHSLCFGLYHNAKQIGFARAITDCATFAYLADVFVVPDYRGRGLGKWLISCILLHPELQGLRRWMLATLDAHGLYEQNGFVVVQNPEWFLEIHNPHIYTQSSTS
ncbi:GNAT family N-acetyltransferase [Nitrosomonas sp. Is37]|uniref:GNAT family N-acetyltransferase n=1 Tax=Nitrosomonas sp. Is37 TaxID=3080535 RepID=UPI00294B48F3|nr:GNAT family N-acetyltransferase [Nitrosomonas sp. Is37]MDV6343502.1 GNAT family N-acetyltransferase [Nitrosomonas sp. Is37]